MTFPCFYFLGTLRVFSIVDVPYCSPFNSVPEFLYLPLLTNSYFLFFWWYWRLNSGFCSSWQVFTFFLCPDHNPPISSTQLGLGAYHHAQQIC
jgi:hypothetical protein